MNLLVQYARECTKIREAALFYASRFGSWVGATERMSADDELVLKWEIDDELDAEAAASTKQKERTDVQLTLSRPCLLWPIRLFFYGTVCWTCVIGRFGASSMGRCALEA